MSEPAAACEPGERASLLERLRSGDREVRRELRGARLLGADLRGLDLSGADLSGADLSGAELSGANLTGAVLSGATLFGAVLEGCELLAANLREANLDECRAERAGFGGADLRGAVLTGAVLRGAVFSGARLAGARLGAADLADGRLREADLTGADLHGAILRNADLTDSRVGGASFSQADLRGARLTGVCGFEEAAWIGVDLRDSDLRGALRLRRFILDENYLHEFRTSGRLEAALYWVWWLTSDCGRSFARWGLWVVLVVAGFAAAYRFVEVDYGDHPTLLSPIYFSVVTITTLGYGDAVPASVAAQGVAMLQVVVGYLALGGLISIFANKMARRAE